LAVDWASAAANVGNRTAKIDPCPVFRTVQPPP
jgi:hypothetical protein